MWRAIERCVVPIVALGLLRVAGVGGMGVANAAQCDKPLYLTLDTGNMEEAYRIADTLRRQGVLATFFVANEKTKSGGHALADEWQQWWRARVQEGHAFGSHTYDHVRWVADTPEGFKVMADAGAQAGKVQNWSAQQFCAEIDRSATRFATLTGRRLSTHQGKTLFRAVGGKTSPKLQEAIGQCGYRHVGWSAAGFLGDELPSETYPNSMLLDKALREIGSGDVLMAHLGIWSRRDPWAPAVLEKLIVGLKARGFCFALLPP